MSRSARLDFAIRAAREAGKSTLSIFGSGHAVDRKADDSPVTEADREAERILRRLIGAAYPGEGIYGEEEGESGRQDRRWVLDPIDGTKSFISGVPLYATLVSFEEQGSATLGVAYFPALDLTLWSEVGAGAFADGNPIRVSDTDRLGDCVLCSGSVRTFEAQGRLEGYLSLARQCLAMRTWCDAYGHALVAMGRVAAMIDPRVEHYDISAVGVIVREAGGCFTAFDGTDHPSGEAISSNAAIHPAIIEAFRS